MKVFISWSGERSKALALALRDWLPLVLHYVDPWLSEADIEAGQRWGNEVAKELEASNFGIICVTKENLNSPWILFEAGALAKSLQDSRVVPLLLDLDFREIGGPLAQFQAKKIEQGGLLEVVQSINQIATQAVAEDRYRQLFSALWADLESKVSAIPAPKAPSKSIRPQTEILEELVGAVRAMESRFRDTDEESTSLRRRQRFHPMVFDELGHMLSEKPGDPIVFLLAASAFKEETPWLYELAMDVYREANSGSIAKAQKAADRLLRALDVTRHGPLLGSESKRAYMMIHELERLLHRATKNLSDSPKLHRKNPDRQEKLAVNE